MATDPASDNSTVRTIRDILFAVLLLGLAGMGAELLLIGHDEDLSQVIPLALIAMMLVVLAWHGLRPSVGTVWAIRGTMVLFILSGLAGVLLHYRGSMEFQLEMDASLSGWKLFWTVMEAKAPPTLAPGSMVQLGMVGLAYAHRHPASTGQRSVI